MSDDKSGEVLGTFCERGDEALHRLPLLGP
jgi:hypothetical protein